MNKKFNLFEINSIFLAPEAPFKRLIPKKFKHTSLAYCILYSIFINLKLIFRVLLFAPFKYKFAPSYRYAHLYNQTILFVAPTLNNMRSMSSIIEKVRKERNNVKIIDDFYAYDAYPSLFMSIVSLVKLPLLWKGFIGLNKESRLIVNFYLISYVYTTGVVWFYKRILSSYKPECIVLANDHTFITKPLVLLCEKYDIPCIYVQHASVSYAFPELRFSHSFLDGEDSLRKYTSKGKNSVGNIILLGAARYDNLSKYRINREKYQRKCIGISLNKGDDNVIADKMCEDLLCYLPDWTIKIRTHPSMKESPFIFTEKERLIYTCATDESIMDYLDSIDVHISNDSGVHLDAILGGVRSIAFNMSRYPYGDNYEYLKNGLIYLAENVEQLCGFVENENYLLPLAETVRQYDEAYRKEYEGNCQNIIAQFILNGIDMKWLKENYEMKKGSLNNVDYYYV